ncbi:MAG: peptidase domain-containing ABC transporter [Pseudomonadota bacterium]
MKQTRRDTRGPSGLLSAFGSTPNSNSLAQEYGDESGLFCLAIIAEHFGKTANIDTLRKTFPPNSGDIPLPTFVAAAYTIGISARPAAIEFENVRDVSLPFVLTKPDGGYAIAMHASSGKLHVLDPADGNNTYGYRELSDVFTPNVIEVVRSDFSGADGNQESVSIRRLVKGIPNFWASAGQILLLAFFLEFLFLLTPLFIQVVTDKVLANQDYTLLYICVAAFLFVAVLQAGISVFRSWLILRLGARVNIGWGTSVFNHLMQVKDGFFSARSIGEINSRFQSVAVIQGTITSRLAEVLLDALLIALTLVVVAVYDFWFLVISLTTFGLYAFFRWLSVRKLEGLVQNSILSEAERHTVFLESVKAYRAIRLNNLVPFQATRYSNAAVDSMNQHVLVERTRSLFGALNVLVANVHRIIFISIGALIILSGSLTIGMLMAALVYSEMFVNRATALVDYAVELKMLGLQADRVADIVLEDCEQNVAALTTIDQDVPSIEFRNVSFRYSESQPWILRNFSMRIEPGESVAVIGKSGCGKSTTVKLLVGLLEPQEGQILVGGEDISSVGKIQLREVISVVMQDDDLLAGTLTDNIALFDQFVDDGRVRDAADKASILPDIELMTNGFDTQVGESHGVLSGGQRQRVLVARALYRDSPILVLDEATSHLDVDTEKRIVGNLKGMKRTRISIAHRPETIASADRVIDLAEINEVRSE